MILVAADVLVPINRFSMFLQKKILIYVDISRKFQQLLERIEKLQRNDGSFFKENAVPFLTISQNHMGLAWRIRNTRLLSEEEELQEFNDDFFLKKIKEPFPRDAPIELKSIFTVDDPIFLVYDVFNISARYTEEEQLQMVNTLTMF